MTFLRTCPATNLACVNTACGLTCQAQHPTYYTAPNMGWQCPKCDWRRRGVERRRRDTEVKKWKAGQDYSTSHYAGTVTFVGGPMDGERGLYDNNWIDVISFCDSAEQVTHDYEPEAKWLSWRYIYKGPSYWTNQPQLYGDPINGWRRRV